jgi:hypothetical protein
MSIKIEEKHGFRFSVVLCDFCLTEIERDKDGVIAIGRPSAEDGGSSIFTICNRRRCARHRKAAVGRAAALMPLAAFIVYLATGEGLDRGNAETLNRKLGGVQ